MRIRLLIDCEGPNPLYSATDHVRVEEAGGIYDVPHTVPIPKGTEIEHREAYYHCLPDAFGVIRAEPIDDAARRKVAQLREWEKKRRAQIAAARMEQSSALAAANRDDSDSEET